MNNDVTAVLEIAVSHQTLSEKICEIVRLIYIMIGHLRPSVKMTSFLVVKILFENHVSFETC